MDIKLTTGAVGALMKGDEVEKPVFQILGFKRIAGAGGADRFRLNISDGLHTHTFAMLATQLNDMVPNGELDNNCIIRAEKLINNNVGENAHRRVLIVLEVTVLAKGTAVGNKIGNPVPYGEATANGTSGRPTQASAPRDTAQLSTQAVKTEFPQRSATSFYGQSKPAAVNGTSGRSNQGQGAGTGLLDSGCVPIRDITPYNSKCTIRARVTSKSTVRTWSNSRGDGKLFNIELLDESGEIKMTGFNNAVDQFYDLITVNDVYIISKFQAKPSNKQFNSMNHDYELSFTNDTQIMPCMEADTEIPTLSFTFTEIGLIENVDKDKIIDVVGVCKHRGDLGTVTTKKDNKEIKKRDITLVDRTNTEVVLTLWGKQAEDFEDDTNPVIAVKAARVGDFNGKNLSLMNSSMMMVNPDIPEAHILRGWYDNEGMNMESRTLVGQRGGAGGNAPWKMISEATASDPTAAEAGYYFKCKGTVLAVKRDNACYKACPEEKCHKKVMDCGDGSYRCEKCNKEYQNFKWRLIVSVNFGDISGSLWATCFQNHGELILDNTTDYLGSIYENDLDQMEAVIKQAAFKSYTLKIRGKMETYNNENRMKYSLMEIQPLNYAEYSQKLLAEIKETIG